MTTALIRWATSPRGPRSPRWPRRRSAAAQRRRDPRPDRAKGRAMRRARRQEGRWRWAVGLTLAAMAALSLFYAQARPRLARRPESERLQHAYAVAQRSWRWEPRPAVACVREFALDHPQVNEPRLRLLLAGAVASQPEGDGRFVADEAEQVAAWVLHQHQLADASLARIFTQMGLRHPESQNPGWPEPFLMTDVDGDGRPDVVFAFPGGMTRSVCCLFRSTPRGWARYRLGTGVPVIGLWSFNITRKGPRAVVMASLADSEYAPNLWLDVFVWRRGR